MPSSFVTFFRTSYMESGEIDSVNNVRLVLKWGPQVELMYSFMDNMGHAKAYFEASFALM